MNREEDEQIARLDFLRGMDESIEKARARLRRMLDGLTPKEREILRKRFGVTTDEELVSGRAANDPLPRVAEKDKP